jgi:aminomethyltransferase
MQTPFYNNHLALNAKIVDFHGWEMPLQYSGIVDEHVNVRKNVGLFDVSHMGRFKITDTGAQEVVQNLVTNDISKVTNGHGLYSPMCYDDGGIIDDLIIYKITEEDFLIVVNASNRTKDLEWMKRHAQSVKIEDISNETVLLALQGPHAQKVLQDLVELDLVKLKQFDVSNSKISGVECMIARTGYTGEDGFEIFFDSSRVEIWNRILESGMTYNIKPAGLGARDTLRIEAGLMLYGNDMDETTTPFEVPLKWTVKLEKEFIGKKALISKDVRRKLTGFEMMERRVARHKNKVLLDKSVIGHVTSGTFSPTLNKSIGFCFVPVDVLENQIVEINIGDKLYKAKICGTRFYKRN